MPLPPPRLTPTARLLVRWLELTSSWSRARAAASSVAFFMAVLVGDSLSGATVSLGFLYLLACAFAVWCLGTTRGMGVSVVGAVVAACVHHQQFSTLLVHRLGPVNELWNLLSRLLSFAILAVLVNGLRTALAMERWRGAHDGLTGALNKAGLERAMPALVARARAAGGTLVLAYVDLDGFKGVNDTLGHATGDTLLRDFVGGACLSIRPSDLFARIGGDEFVTVLALPKGVDGAHVADLLHRRLTAILARTGHPVTCSMGATVMAARDAALDAGALASADALMYEVKRAGKNALRVTSAAGLTGALRAAFRPPEGEELHDLLRRIDMAERNGRWGMRQAA